MSRTTSCFRARRGGGGDRGAARRGRRFSVTPQMVARGVTRARSAGTTTKSICTLNRPRHVAALAKPGSTPRARRRRSISGANGWPARWWRSATRRRRCSGCSNCSTPAPQNASLRHRHARRLRRCAAESKDALIARPAFRSLVVRGRRGGSAMAAAAVNALASAKRIERGRSSLRRRPRSRRSRAPDGESRATDSANAPVDRLFRQGGPARPRSPDRRPLHPRNRARSCRSTTP